MEKEFNLSDKIHENIPVKYMFDDGDRTFEEGEEYDFIRVEDVKEFIKRLKEELNKYCNNKDKVVYVELFKEDIDKLAGDKLR